MSLSLHFDIKNKDILILSEVLTQELDDTTLTTEAIYPINILSLHITEATVCYSLMLKKHISSSQKILK